MPGMLTSSSTRSNGCCPMARNASSPFRASSTVNPPAVSDFRRALRRENSSSTSRTLVAVDGMLDHIRVKRHGKAESHVVFGRAFQGQAAPMGSCNFPRDIESEAGPGREQACFGAAVKPVENAIPIVARNEASVIGDADGK